MMFSVYGYTFGPTDEDFSHCKCVRENAVNISTIMSNQIGFAFAGRTVVFPIGKRPYGNLLAQDIAWLCQTDASSQLITLSLEKPVRSGCTHCEQFLTDFRRDRQMSKAF